jgi:hypothetical protein
LENGPGTLYLIEVDGPDGPSDAGALPPPIRFAARFVTAWASRDQDTAFALSRAVAESADTNGTDD